VKFLCRRISSGERTLFYFAEVLVEKIERSKFYVEKYSKTRELLDIAKEKGELKRVLF
jgi:hypothetical protein